MRKLFLFLRGVFVAALLLLPACAQAGKRIALVIGNANYTHAPTLPNPVRDAAAMGQLFRDAHFDVVDEKRNLDAASFRAALKDFSVAAADVDIAVVYFAGHGLELGGVNYLVPTDARLARDIDVEDEAISLDRVQRSMDRARQLRLVLLDACRENPFVSEMKRTSPTRGVTRGLARIPEEDTNSLVSFAAKAGSVAADGEADHSPYTAALLVHLTTPGLDIRFALGKVRDTVVNATRGRGEAQVPAVYGSYGGDALPLVPAPPAGSPPAASVSQGPPASKPASPQTSMLTVAPAPSDPAEGDSAAGYQELFEAKLRERQYPQQVRAVCRRGVPLFQALFRPFPPGPFHFVSHHGISDALFERNDIQYRRRGLHLIWHDRIDCNGRTLNQATWTN